MDNVNSGNVVTFLGAAKGKFKTEAGELRDYYSLFCFSPVSQQSSDTYSAFGYKAEKLRCVSPDIWEGFSPFDQVDLYYDRYGRVCRAVLVKPGNVKPAAPKSAD